MLDANEARLTRTGTVTISREGIEIVGFDGDGTSCRDIAALAMAWAIGELQRDLVATLERPGGGSSSVD